MGSPARAARRRLPPDAPHPIYYLKSDPPALVTTGEEAAECN